MGMIGYYKLLDDKDYEKLSNGDSLPNEYIDFSNDDSYDYLDIDKTWNAINYVLVGDLDGDNSENPFSKLIFGGQYIEDEEIPYGSFLINKKEVMDLRKNIDTVIEEDFRKNFSVKEMLEAGVYPVYEGDLDEEEEFFQYVYSAFYDIKRFFRRAEEEEKAILFCII